MSQTVLPRDLNLSPVLPVSIEPSEALGDPIDRYRSAIQHAYQVGPSDPAPLPSLPWVVMAARTQQLLDAVASGDSYRQAMLEGAGLDSLCRDQ